MNEAELLSDAELDEIQDRLFNVQEGLPEGPWEVQVGTGQVFIGPARVNTPGRLSGFKALLFEVDADGLALFDDKYPVDDPEMSAEAVAEFCANARQDIPRLLATIKHLKKELDKR